MADIYRRKNTDGVFDAAKAREDNLIGRKLQELRVSHRLSLAGMSSRLAAGGLDVSLNAINKWELGQSSPSAYQLLAVCSVFGIDDSVEYFTGKQLLNSEGRSKVASYRDDLIASGNYRPEAEKPEADEGGIIYVYMPVSLMPASAGTGDFLDDGCFEDLRFPQSSVPSGADFGVRVHGDSMEPVYSNGQIVWVKKCTSLRPGDVGLFMLNGNGYIKSYREQLPEDADAFTDIGGTVHMQPKLVSYNPAYPPMVVGAEDSFRIFGRIL